MPCLYMRSELDFMFSIAGQLNTYYQQQAVVALEFPLREGLKVTTSLEAAARGFVLRCIFTASTDDTFLGVVW